MNFILKNSRNFLLNYNVHIFRLVSVNSRGFSRGNKPFNNLKKLEKEKNIGIDIEDIDQAETSYSQKIDKDLNDFVEKKLKEGLKEEEILKEWSRKSQDDKPKSDFHKSFDRKAYIENNKDLPIMREFSKAENHYETLQKILDNKPDNLQELPNEPTIRANKSLTDTEKLELEARVGILRSKIGSGEINPKKLNPKNLLSITEPTNETSTDKSALKKKEQTHISERTPKTFDPELKFYNDNMQTYNKEKLLKKSMDDQLLITNVPDKTSRWLDLDRNRKIHSPTTFDKSRDRANRMLNILDLDPEEDLEEMITLEKEILFKEKKLAEEEILFQKRKMVREQKKEFKKIQDDLSVLSLKDDINYEDEAPEKFNIKKNLYGLPDEAQMEHLKTHNEKILNKKGDKRFEIYRQQSFTCFREYLENHFAPWSNAKESIWKHSLGKKFLIENILPNYSMTVLNVFWKFMENDQGDEELRLRVSNRLNAYGKKLSFKMCQDIGIRKGPELRFHYSDFAKRNKEVEMEFYEEAKKNVDNRIKEEASKNKEVSLTPETYSDMLEENVDALKNYFRKQYDQSTILKEKKKNLGPEGREHKKKRKSKKTLRDERIDKFWINLD